MGDVWSELLLIGPTTCEIYLQSFPDLAGCSFRDVRRCFSAATIIGYHSASLGIVRLNPPETDVIEVCDFYHAESTINPL